MTLFILCLLCVHCVSGKVPGLGDMTENKRDSQETGSEVPKTAFHKGCDAEGLKGTLRAFQNLMLNNLESHIQVICPSVFFQAL